MTMFKTDYEWINRLAPEGIPIPSSILISGPGGSGKPLIGLAIVASWLRRGGRVVFAPLQYPDPRFTRNDLLSLYDLDLADFADSSFFLEFDVDLEPTPDAMERVEPNLLRANFVNPKVWDEALEIAVSELGPSPVGTLVFGSAINLLLFSKTYGEQFLEHLKHMLHGDENITYLFAVSSTVLKQMIEQLEAAANHLFFAKMIKDDGLLQFWIKRLNGAQHVDEKITVPISREHLRALKQQAESAKVTRIPAIQKI